MCKLAIIIKQEGADMKSLSDVLTVQWPTIELERDGIGSVIVGQDNTPILDRKLEPKEYDGVFSRFIERLDSAKIGVLHTRFATVGAKTLANVHQYKHNGLVFAHNGHVGAYSGWGEGSGYTYPKASVPIEIRNDIHLATVLGDGTWYTSTNGYTVKRKHALNLYNSLIATLGKCDVCREDINTPCVKHTEDSMNMQSVDELLRDGYVGKINLFGTKKVGKEVVPYTKPVPSSTESDSLRFMKSLGVSPNIKDIESAVKRASFSGIATLLDTNAKVLYLIGTRAFKVQRGDGWLAIYSWLPVEKYGKYEYMFGLPVVGKSTEVPASDMVADVYALKYDGAMSVSGTEATW